MHEGPVGGVWRRGGGSSTKLYFYLVNLSNRIVDTGKYPALWSFCLIVPIHKNDDRSKVENYRGITLLSALGKPFTSILLYMTTFRPEVQPLTVLQTTFCSKGTPFTNLVLIRTLHPFQLL